MTSSSHFRGALNDRFLSGKMLTVDFPSRVFKRKIDVYQGLIVSGTALLPNWGGVPLMELLSSGRS